MIQANVPDDYLVASFFEKGEKISFNEQQAILLQLEENPLLLDMFYNLNVDTEKPWLNKHHYIPVLLENWSKMSPIITNYFSKRDRKQALEPMKKMILTFICFLFWLNDQPVTTLKNVTELTIDLTIKPVNVQERLAYIITAPNHHHAFTQLNQLFIELQKKYAVLKMKTNKG